jgi:hypothetical protein
MNRRDFLQVLGLGGVAAVLGVKTASQAAETPATDYLAINARHRQLARAFKPKKIWMEDHEPGDLTMPRRTFKGEMGRGKSSLI